MKRTVSTLPTGASEPAAALCVLAAATGNLVPRVLVPGGRGPVPDLSARSERAGRAAHATEEPAVAEM